MADAVQDRNIQILQSDLKTLHAIASERDLVYARQFYDSMALLVSDKAPAAQPAKTKAPAADGKPRFDVFYTLD